MSVALSSALLATSATAAPSGPDLSDRPDRSRVTTSLAEARKAIGFSEDDGQITALVALDTAAGVDVAAKGADAVLDAAETTQELAEDVVPAELTAKNAGTATPKRLGTVTNLMAGTLVTGDAKKIAALASSDEVTAIYRVATKKPMNSNTDAFTRALQTWQDTGNTGEGVTIAVIDTGLDYTHAAFGGLGTQEAYDEAYGEDGTQPVDPAWFDAAKYLGGYDFAGPLYDASLEEPGSTDVPTPDENPIDSLSTSPNSGHGTHVAGTAAGYGVTPDGDTFDGDYAELTDLSGWKVGPGSAPRASIWAFKVFGDIGGSTDVTALALDRAADPNGDGDFSDHVDVVNMSLGSDGSPADDPDNVLVDKLTNLGVVVAVASGNAGDITDVGGAPGNAASSLTVANSVGAPVLDAARVEEADDADLIGTTVSGQNSVAYAGDDVTAPVVFLGEDFDGCATFTPEQADAVEGKIAYLWWDETPNRVCGSAVRFNNASNAGAAGVLLPTDVAVFSAGIAGNAAIPGFQMTKTATEALMAEVEAGTLTLTIGPGLAMAGSQDGAGDLLNSGSSRGVHGSLGIVKPDVAAPGTSILSAASGGGAAGHVLSGTSMATPHVAGIAALVRAEHPAWTAAQVKAAVMNTATHDVTTEAGGAGLAYGPERVGSGRVDARAAVDTDVIAYSSDDRNLVSVAFGVVDVADEVVTRKATVKVANFGSADRTYDTAFVAASTAGGADITVTPAQVTVPAGGKEATLTLTLTLDPSTLEREIDPTQELDQYGFEREYVTTLSGRVVLTSTDDDQELRVPVQAAPRLVSDLSASKVTFSGSSLDSELALSGRGVDAGGWTSLTSPLILARTSPRLEKDASLTTSASAIASGDLRYVGWSSNAQYFEELGLPSDYATLNIGIAVDGDWASIGNAVIPVIDIDTDGDGEADLQSIVTKLDPEVDVTVVLTYDLNGDPEDGPVDWQYVNGVIGADTGLFDSNVLVAPIGLEYAGIESGTSPTVQVWTYSPYARDEVVDAVAPFTVSPFDAPFWFETDDFVLSVGDDGVSIPVHRSGTATSGKLLVLQHHNAGSSRAQVVDVSVPARTTTKLTFTPGAKPTDKATLTATVSPTAAAGKVEFFDGKKSLGKVSVSKGKATTKVAVTLGSHSYKAVFTPTSATAYQSSTSALVKVTKSKTTTSLTLSPTTVKKGTAAKAVVTVKGASKAPTGKVEIKENGKVIATGTLKVTGTTGKVTITLPKTLAVGKHSLTASYAGSAYTGSSWKTATLTVTR
ncbi:S8 family serine peptidase [Cellulomonas palmilytica]|uniref:S8 family serine peptidase n=1 Tax=Cellulomonas palmilytica TaxID=2608402 RepID=UPI0029500890|nr:S8 family serine peptidase [Cellulomonas palmilytica]